jgi:hypothetical protein
VLNKEIPMLCRGKIPGLIHPMIRIALTPFDWFALGEVRDGIIAMEGNLCSWFEQSADGLAKSSHWFSPFCEA